MRYLCDLKWKYSYIPIEYAFSLTIHLTTSQIEHNLRVNLLICSHSALPALLFPELCRFTLYLLLYKQFK